MAKITTLEHAGTKYALDVSSAITLSGMLYGVNVMAKGIIKMKINVVTDSTSDIPEGRARELGITVVPVYLRFGDTQYRDGVDIPNADFYSMLASSPVHPTTSQPSPEDFATVYRENCDAGFGIVSIHISSRISGTHDSAMIAKSMLADQSNIEVIDSRFNSAGLGLVVMAAARLAQSGAGLSEVVDEANRAIKAVSMFGMFATTKYLARSGRVNKTVATASSILNVMPLLTFRDGDIVRAGLVRTVDKGMERICDFVRNAGPISELIIVHSQVTDQANRLKQRLGRLLEVNRMSIAELGASLGVHGGPGVLLTAIRRTKVAE